MTENTWLGKPHRGDNSPELSQRGGLPQLGWLLGRCRWYLGEEPAWGMASLLGGGEEPAWGMASLLGGGFCHGSLAP